MQLEALKTSTLKNNFILSKTDIFLFILVISLPLQVIGLDIGLTISIDYIIATLFILVYIPYIRLTRVDRYDIFLIFFLVWVFLSQLYNIIFYSQNLPLKPPSLGGNLRLSYLRPIYQILRLGFLFLIYKIFKNYLFYRSDKIKQMSLVLVIALTLLSFYGIYQFLALRYNLPIANVKMIRCPEILAIREIIKGGPLIRRIFATFKEPNNYGHFLIMAIPFIWGYSKLVETKKYKNFILFIIVLSSSNLFFTFARGSIGAFVLGLLLFAPFIHDKNFIKLIYLVLLGFLLGALIMNLVYEINLGELFPSFVKSYQYGHDISSICITQKTAEVVRNTTSNPRNILFGQGLGNFAIMNTPGKIIPVRGLFPKLFADTGIVGMLLFILFALRHIWVNLKIKTGEESKEVLFSKYLSLAILIGLIQMSFLYNGGLHLIYFWFFLAVSAVSHRIISKKQSKPVKGKVNILNVLMDNRIGGPQLRATKVAKLLKNNNYYTIIGFPGDSIPWTDRVNNSVTKFIIVYIGIVVGLALIIVSIIFSPEIVANNFSPDCVIGPRTTQKVQNLRILTSCIALVALYFPFTSFLYKLKTKNRKFKSISLQGYLKQNTIPYATFNLKRIRKPQNIISNFKWFFNFLPGVFQLVLFIKRNNINVVHANGLMHLQAPIAAKLTNTKLVWHLNDSIISLPSFLKILLAKLPPIMANHICYSSQNVKQYLYDNKNIDLSRETILGVPVDLNEFNELNDKKREKLLREFNLNSKYFVIMTIGNLTTNKNIETLLQAFQIVNNKYKNTKLIIVGAPLETQKNYYNSLKNYAGELEIEKEIIFAGFRKDIPYILNIADVYVCTSLSESGPMTVLEAIAAQVPVISTPVGLVTDVIKDDEAGYIIPFKDYKALSEKMCILMEDKEKRSKFAEKAMQNLKEKFTLSQCARRHIQVYEKLIVGSKKRDNVVQV